MPSLAGRRTKVDYRDRERRRAQLKEFVVFWQAGGSRSEYGLPSTSITRRTAIAGLVSAAVSSPATAGLQREPDIDVLIIVAGAARIAAGRRLLASKKKFAIVEARNSNVTFHVHFGKEAIRLSPSSRPGLNIEAF